MDHDFSIKIKKELVEKIYYDNIKYDMKSSMRWKILSDITEAIAQLALCISIILTFAGSIFNNNIVTYVSGCVAISSLSFLRFSIYSKNESKERIIRINSVLAQLGIEPITEDMVNNINNTDIMNTCKNINNVEINNDLTYDDILQNYQESDNNDETILDSDRNLEK